jgi:hypothetical protein
VRGSRIANRHKAARNLAESAARGRPGQGILGMTEESPACGCGARLREWGYDSGRRTQRLWCVDLADLLAYRKGQPTRHDILSPNGERLQQGSCQSGGQAGTAENHDG